MKIQIPNKFFEYLSSGKPTEGALKRDPGWYQLWSEEEIEELNKAYEVHKVAPSHIGFGSNGAGEMLAFNSKGQVVMIPFVGMADDEATVIADSWKEFEEFIVD